MQELLYVRPMTDAEREQVAAGLRSTDRFTVRRCQVVQASARGEPALGIARVLAAGQALDHQPRPRVRAKKSARDRLIRRAASHPDWVLGFQDEVWWSRLARPCLRCWAEADQRVRLVEQAVAKDDPDPKALACYGLYLRPPEGAPGRMWLRFVDGRPVSAVTVAFLEWCAKELAAEGKKALLLVWDNASWH